MIFDNHVHMGWYSNGYHTPYEIWSAIEYAGIDKIAVSSTSTCAELYNNIKTEFYQLMAIAGQENIYPILWITPNMIKKHWPIQKLIKSKIKWRGLKMHWQAHPDFYSERELTNEVLKLSKLMGNLPILLHTGEFDTCRANVFEPIISENPDVKFILAHGRPINETVTLLKKYNNVWTDTAFMPNEDIIFLIEEGVVDKILYGTDFPINSVYYTSLSNYSYLKSKLAHIKLIDKNILHHTIFELG